MSFYDRKEVRDILAYLKLLAAPGDEVSLRRIINTPARGIGQKAVGALVDEAVAHGKPLWDILADAAPTAGAVSLRRSKRSTSFSARSTEFRKRLTQRIARRRRVGV